MSRWGVVGAVATLVVSTTACSIEDMQSAPDCATGDTWIIAAQSVPTADLVPCFERLPDGWHVDSVTIDQDGTVIRFDSDRAGDDAAIFHYASSCDVGDAVTSPSDQEGANRFDFIELVDPVFRAHRYYVFDGGCIWWEFDFDAGATAALSIDLGERLVTTRREVLDEILRETFIDEGL